MKNWILILPLAFCIQACAQNFEGIISYNTTYESNVEGVTAKEMFGQESSLDTTYFKNDSYLNKSTTEFMSFQLWRGTDTMQYFKNMSSQDTIWFDRTDSHPSSFDSTHIVLNADTVAGYLCNKLIVYRGNRTYTYFYNPDFKLDPNHYRHYSNSSKFEIMKLIKSPYLRLKITSPSNGLDMIAVNVNIESLSDTIFEVPDGILTKAEY
jgi:hypothetical protein